MSNAKGIQTFPQGSNMHKIYERLLARLSISKVNLHAIRKGLFPNIPTISKMLHLVAKPYLATSTTHASPPANFANGLISCQHEFADMTGSHHVRALVWSLT